MKEPRSHRFMTGPTTRGKATIMEVAGSLGEKISMTVSEVVEGVKSGIVSTYRWKSQSPMQNVRCNVVKIDLVISPLASIFRRRLSKGSSTVHYNNDTGHC